VAALTLARLSPLALPVVLAKLCNVPFKRLHLP